MPKAPTVHIAAGDLREKILALLREHPQGMRIKELSDAILGPSDDYDEVRARSARITYSMKQLVDMKHVKKGPHLLSPFFIREGRPEPEVHDIPRNGASRGRPRGSKNGVVEGGSLRAYIIRDIRAKLTELEALD